MAPNTLEQRRILVKKSDMALGLLGNDALTHLKTPISYVGKSHIGKNNTDKKNSHHTTEMSTYTRATLKNAGILTLDDLRYYKLEELQKLGIGENALKKLQKAVHEQGGWFYSVYEDEDCENIIRQQITKGEEFLSQNSGILNIIKINDVRPTTPVKTDYKIMRLFTEFRESHNEIFERLTTSECMALWQIYSKLSTEFDITITPKTDAQKQNTPK